MIADAQLQLCNAQAFTADANSSNVLDLGVARRVFDGKALGVACAVDVAADFTTGNETYTFNVVTDDNDSLSSATTIGTVTLLAATLILGYQFVIPIAMGTIVERYVALAFDGGGTTPTITLTAFLMPIDMIGALFPATRQHYPDNITIQ